MKLESLKSFIELNKSLNENEMRVIVGGVNTYTDKTSITVDHGVSGLDQPDIPLGSHEDVTCMGDSQTDN